MALGVVEGRVAISSKSFASVVCLGRAFMTGRPASTRTLDPARFPCAFFALQDESAGGYWTWNEDLKLLERFGNPCSRVHVSFWHILASGVVMDLPLVPGLSDFV